ncbi:beta-L-arabinofuranosidase domain-containing protein [Roseiflexus castenholzii]|jgi:DUF1680 family protein|uniref:Uncharacterized protein n=1 Tax=Roseiflexus castenholzii (strain DSM 13941 / HLO8) TaxID=383372 RepID=A7NIY0_ROSCS|nr:beta-L-arabinofuranosidase domain-containing protein [Roseiflexus castenholzii]ABU57438.1 protein of unknown function DUF1680 [Roseiflexus castenholzii DSM 13941]
MKSSPLTPLVCIPLPTGAVRPRGWLYRQLRLQADGLSGHLDQCWPDVADSAWIGGAAEGWERGPYWLDGMVPLAFVLNDASLIARVSRWIDIILEQQHDDGWLGPRRDASDARRRSLDPWPVFVLLKALSQFQEATGDRRVIPAMLRFLRRLDALLDEQPLFDWGRYRWADLVVSLHWLYDRTRESWLLDLAEKAQRQGFDWRAHFEQFPYPSRQRREDIYPPAPLPGCTFRLDMASHVVNNAMAIKTSGVWYRQSGDPRDRDAVWQAIETLDAFHGQVNGVFSGDEHLAGLNPSQGTELCAVVEYQYSLETLISMLGDPRLADRLERITFNALPAAFAPDMWSHQYVQQVNQIRCAILEDNIYTNNRADANTFGLEPNYGCCTANMHQGWPKFVTHLWMRTSGDGLAAVSYAPCELTMTAGGRRVRLTVETDYPFDESVRIVVESRAAARFPLLLRFPGWAVGATLSIDGRRETVHPGTFHRVERVWDGAVTIDLHLPMRVAVTRRPSGSAAIEYGPLVFALPIGETWQRIVPDAQGRYAAGERLRPGCPPDIADRLGDWEVLPTTPWNYGLELDAAQPERSVRIVHHPVGERPFSPEGAPVAAYAHGRRIPTWGEEHGAAGPPPAPVHVDTSLEVVRLIPYGCTNLRIAEFPLLESGSTTLQDSGTP